MDTSFVGLARHQFCRYLAENAFSYCGEKGKPLSSEPCPADTDNGGQPTAALVAGLEDQRPALWGGGGRGWGAVSLD